jgi:hypothetical protein
MEKLPIELFYEITKYLNIYDLINLRLTIKIFTKFKLQNVIDINKYQIDCNIISNKFILENFKLTFPKGHTPKRYLISVFKNSVLISVNNQLWYTSNLNKHRFCRLIVLDDTITTIKLFENNFYYIMSKRDFPYNQYFNTSLYKFDLVTSKITNLNSVSDLLCKVLNNYYFSFTGDILSVYNLENNELIYKKTFKYNTKFHLFEYSGKCIIVYAKVFSFYKYHNLIIKSILITKNKIVKTKITNLQLDKSAIIYKIFSKYDTDFTTIIFTEGTCYKEKELLLFKNKELITRFKSNDFTYILKNPIMYSNIIILNTGMNPMKFDVYQIIPWKYLYSYTGENLAIYKMNYNKLILYKYFNDSYETEKLQLLDFS